MVSFGVGGQPVHDQFLWLGWGVVTELTHCSSSAHRDPKQPFFWGETREWRRQGYVPVLVFLGLPSLFCTEGVTCNTFASL